MALPACEPWLQLVPRRLREDEAPLLLQRVLAAALVHETERAVEEEVVRGL